MTFIPNETGLARLLLSETGPVGIKTRVATEAVLGDARKRLRDVIKEQKLDPEGMVDGKVEETPVGPVGRVGAVDKGSVSRRMAQKAIDEKNSGAPGDWLAPALDVLIPLGWKVVR